MNVKSKVYLFTGFSLAAFLLLQNPVKAEARANLQPIINKTLHSSPVNVQMKTGAIKKRKKFQLPLKTKKLKREAAGIKKNILRQRRLVISQKRAAAREKVKKLLLRRRQAFQQIKNRFQKNLQKIKDERKKRIISRIEKRLNALNQRIIDRLNRRLDRLEELLTKIQSRAAKMAENGIDTTQINQTINSIQADIDNLRNKLTEQAGKSYTPEINDQSGLRIAAGQSYRKLRQDFKELHRQLVKIRKEIADLLHLLAQLQGGRP